MRLCQLDRARAGRRRLVGHVADDRAVRPQSTLVLVTIIFPAFPSKTAGCLACMATMMHGPGRGREKESVTTADGACRSFGPRKFVAFLLFSWILSTVMCLAGLVVGHVLRVGPKVVAAGPYGILFSLYVFYISLHGPHPTRPVSTGPIMRAEQDAAWKCSHSWHWPNTAQSRWRGV